VSNLFSQIKLKFEAFTLLIRLNNG